MLDSKTIAVIILGLVLIFAAYTILSKPATPKKYVFDPGPSVAGSEFISSFNSASQVNIYEDVREANTEDLRSAIFQCGIDFASSDVLATKTVIPISIDKDQCVYPQGTLSTSECEGLLKNGVTIYIKPGSGLTYYKNALFVGINENYSLGSCIIRLKPASNTTAPINTTNTTN